MGTSLGLGLVSFLFLLRLALFSSHFFFQFFMCFYRSFAPVYLRLILFFFSPSLGIYCPDRNPRTSLRCELENWKTQTESQFSE